MSKLDGQDVFAECESGGLHRGTFWIGRDDKRNSGREERGYEDQSSWYGEEGKGHVEEFIEGRIESGSEDERDSEKAETDVI